VMESAPGLIGPVRHSMFISDIRPGCEFGRRWDYLEPLERGFNAVHIVPTGEKSYLSPVPGTRRPASSPGPSAASCAAPRCRTVGSRTLRVDLFCAGRALLPDGRALVGGGTISYHPIPRGPISLRISNFAP
jgi:hypothetical protein